MGLFDFDNGRDSKRSLTQREKQFLYENAKGRCENPACKKKITFFEMQVGHKRAWSRGGSTTLKNCVCLCYKCNHDRTDDHWEVFLKKRGVETPEMKAKQVKTQVKQELGELTIQQLKLLATKHKVKVSGYVEESLFSSRRVAPTKSDYIKKLSAVVASADMRSMPEVPPKPVKKRTRRQSNNSLF